MSKTTIIDGVDYGPLAALVGLWEGDSGLDVAPDPDGEEINPYYETILFEAVDTVTNAEKQTVAAVRYHQVVSRKSTRKVFHNETGYWSWDPATGIVMHSLTIPRGLCVLAGGTAPATFDGDNVTLDVAASETGDEWRIIQSPFMRDKARATKFDHHLTVCDDELSYAETTVVEIFDKVVDHTDENTLTRTKM
jgi:hypothetical protein